MKIIVTEYFPCNPNALYTEGKTIRYSGKRIVQEMWEAGMGNLIVTQIKDGYIVRQYKSNLVSEIIRAIEIMRRGGSK